MVSLGANFLMGLNNNNNKNLLLATRRLFKEAGGAGREPVRTANILSMPS